MTCLLLSIVMIDLFLMMHVTMRCIFSLIVTKGSCIVGIMVHWESRDQGIMSGMVCHGVVLDTNFLLVDQRLDSILVAIILMGVIGVAGLFVLRIVFLVVIGGVIIVMLLGASDHLMPLFALGLDLGADVLNSTVLVVVEIIVRLSIVV